MLSDEMQNLVALARDPASSEEDLRGAAQAFLEAASQATPKDAKAALAELAGHMSLDDVGRGAFLALVCGALVEDGCDPAAMTEPLIGRLQYLLESAAELADACRARLPQSNDEAPEKEVDEADQFESVLEQVAGDLPLEYDAWQALQQFWRPAIAVFSVSAPARAAARDLRGLAAKIAEYHEGGHWLRLMLSVLDDEPILAIEPQSGLGILGRISGVVDNFQLHVLLMDGFPRVGMQSRRRVPRRVAEVALGIGPQQSDDTVTGVWNLYTWQAIQSGLKLPAAGDQSRSDCWIWNEGTPDDVPVFEGRRIILLGPPAYARTWRSQRMFDKLPAKLEIDSELSTRDLNDWLQRMLSAQEAS
ncbi:MAG: hypothetical protein FJ271_30855 [Planctomycetes bacterium]|nr:hypothetical protein [Planctomycetota bacterium]